MTEAAQGDLPTIYNPKEYIPSWNSATFGSINPMNPYTRQLKPFFVPNKILRPLPRTNPTDFSWKNKLPVILDKKWSLVNKNIAFPMGLHPNKRLIRPPT